jgi:hypothetical protein
MRIKKRLSACRHQAAQNFALPSPFLPPFSPSHGIAARLQNAGRQAWGNVPPLNWESFRVGRISGVPVGAGQLQAMMMRLLPMSAGIRPT